MTTAPAYAIRRHLWLTAGEPLVCPNGHRIKSNAAILTHEALTCLHQEPHQRGACNSRIYVIAYPRDGLRFVAEVTTDELLFMRDHGMSIADALRYLREHAA